MGNEQGGVPVARYGECAILVHLHELGRDPVILGKLLKG